LYKRKILEVLKQAEEPLSIDEISEKTDAPIARLRVDLFRLMEEGKVERRIGKEIRWTIKVSRPIEERYEKLSKKPHM